MIAKISHPAFGTACTNPAQADSGCIWGKRTQLPGFLDHPISGNLQIEFFEVKKSDPSSIGEAVLELELQTDHLHCDCTYNMEYEWDCGSEFSFSFRASSSEPKPATFFSMNPNIFRNVCSWIYI